MSRMPQFAELHNGDMNKLNEVLQSGEITFPAYIFDEKQERLMYVNKDKTYTYIKGDPTVYQAYTGTEDAPINVSNLPNGMYIIDGYYTIKGIDTIFVSEIPLLFLIGTTNEGEQKITCFSSTQVTTYTVTEEETTESVPVTTDNVTEIVTEQIEDSFPPATDDDIDAMFDF